MRIIKKQMNNIIYTAIPLDSIGREINFNSYLIISVLQYLRHLGVVEIVKLF